jgi:hypothetical protein
MMLQGADLDNCVRVAGIINGTDQVSTLRLLSMGPQPAKPKFVKVCSGCQGILILKQFNYGAAGIATWPYCYTCDKKRGRALNKQEVTEFELGG